MEFSDILGDMTVSAKINLSISLNKVEVFFKVISNLDLPTIKQRTFLNEIVSNYDKVLISLHRTLPKELSHLSKQQLKDSFNIETIGISLIDKGELDWDMSMKSKINSRLTLIIFLKGMQVVSTAIDFDKRNSLTRFIHNLLSV